MNIYEVKVCEFHSIEPAGSVSKLHRGEFVTHYCVVDFSNFLAVDIFTEQQYQILQRNEQAQILSSEKVELYKEYALYFQKLDQTKLSEKELKKIKLAYLKFDYRNKKKSLKLKKQFQKVIKR